MKVKRDGDTPINTRYPKDILEDMRKLAERHERSFNGEVMWALREYINQQKGEQQRDKSV